MKINKTKIVLYIFIAGAIILMSIAAVLLARQFLRKSPAAHASISKSKGSLSSPVKITIYSDFQCPACVLGAQKVDEFFNEFSPVAFVEFRHFPLAMHPMAMEAALFSECAAQQGKFWSYHDRLFKDRNDWVKLPNPTARFWQFAEEDNLNMKKLEACIVNPQSLSAVKKDKLMGEVDQVKATPTILLNGQRMVGGKQFEEQAKKFALEELKRLGIPWKPVERVKGRDPVMENPDRPAATGSQTKPNG